jgi:hypothetical protein
MTIEIDYPFSRKDEILKLEQLEKAYLAQEGIERDLIRQKSLLNALIRLEHSIN